MIRPVLRRREGAALVALLGSAVASAGCAAGMSLAELPAEPIAVRYLDPAQARRASEERARREQESRRGRAGRPGPERLGVASLDDLDRFLSSSLHVRDGSPREGHRREADERSPRLALLHPRSSRLEVVPAARAGSIPVDWSPGRRYLLFAQIRRGYEQLFEYDLERGEVRPVTREPGAHPWGCYGAGGRIVAERVHFGAGPPRSQLVISEPGGGRFRDLTPGPADQRPACAPDGSAVTYIAGGRGPQGRVVVRRLSEALPSGADAPDARVRVGPAREIGPGIDPSFSPDGGFVVYSAMSRVRTEAGVRERWRLRRARVSGLRRASFELGPLDQLEPAISPDGRSVVYVGVDPEFNQALYVRRLDGSGERILFNDGAALGPVW